MAELIPRIREAFPPPTFSPAMVERTAFPAYPKSGKCIYTIDTNSLRALLETCKRRRLSMKTFLSVTLVSGAMLCAAAFAQSEPPSAQNPSAPAAQPQAQPQPASPSQAQPQQQAPQANQPPTSAPTGANQAQAPSTPRIAPGSVIPVQLTKTIDAKKAKTGDPIVAKVTMDMTTSTGEVLVPKDAKVMGHITEAQARTKEQKESQVGIAFDRAVLKGGEVPLPMSIQAVIAPPGNNVNNGSDSDQAASPPPVGGSAASPMSGGRNASAGQTQATGTSPSALPSEGASGSQGGGAHRPINGNTQGVVGISNLKLESGQSPAQGSVLSSEKNNVKVESGTMLLLKVNP
jgi:hypothetical protein